PDTLVQKKGAAGLEEILKDAVDVLERKIQILDRKGFFGTLPGRRRALDRLLPTIRAAADPITQELYMSRAAEAAGVRKDVLEREVTNAGAGSGERYPSARSAGTVSTGENRSPLPAPALPASAEKTLLLLLQEKDQAVNQTDDALAALEPATRALDESQAAAERALGAARAAIQAALDRRDELEGKIASYRNMQEQRRQRLEWVRGAKEASTL